MEPLPDSKGIEFKLTRNGAIQFHQVKRGASRSAGWTLRALGKEGVLETINVRLREPGTTFHLMSYSPAVDLGELADHAKTIPDWSEFHASILQNPKRKRIFRELNDAWQNARDEDTHSMLQRVYFTSAGEGFVTEENVNRLGYLVDGNPATASDVLQALTLRELHKKLDAKLIWQYLAKHGISPRSSTSTDVSIFTTFDPPFFTTFDPGGTPSCLTGFS